MRHKTELECPRCRMIVDRRAARQACCERCGAELVPAHGPSEASVRAYLYGAGRRESRVAIRTAER